MGSSARHDHAAPAAALSRPASDVSTGVGLVGLVGLVCWVAFCRNWAAIADAFAWPGPRLPMSGPYAAVMALAASAVPMVLWSLLVDRVHLRASTGIDWANPRPLRAIRRISAVKLVGLWATWGLIGFFYCLARWYWRGPYLFAMHVIGAAGVAMALLSVPYVLWLDRVLVNPRDGAWHCGALLLGHEGADKAQAVRHLRAWAVKGFFSAFMISILPGGFATVVNFDLARGGHDPVRLANWLIDCLFMLDVQIGTVGYLLTLRPLDAHIRSANPYLDGWLAALVCYPPFVLMAGGGPLDYHPATADWSYWMADWPVLLWLWGGLLVMLTGVYAWATLAFGMRFSNLTWRGVLTHGPYALTRHPAYLSKNLFWWCATLPFLATSHSLTDAIRNSVILALVSGVYWWRARTEERHLLSEDAKYVAYWRWAGEHAPFTRALARLGRWLRGARGGKPGIPGEREAEPAE